MKRLWPWLSAAASGIMLTLCFPPFNLGELVWLALIPLIIAVWFSESWTKWNPLRVFLLGQVTGAIYFLGTLHWISCVTVPGYILMGLYLGIYPAVWAVFLSLVRPDDVTTVQEGSLIIRKGWLTSRANLKAGILAAAAWVGLEWLRGIVFTGFGWNGLGVALRDNLALIQICDITGVGGVSFMVALVNVILVATIHRLRLEFGKHKLRPHYDFSFSVAVVAVVFAYGVNKIMAPAEEATKLSVGAVQANIPIVEKRNPEQEQQILDIHKRLSEAAITSKVDLLVWPEAATPYPLFRHQPSFDTVVDILHRLDGDFLLGTVHLDKTGDHNSAVLVTPNDWDPQFYHKNHLVPFGEYVPLRKSFPLFAMIVGDLVPEDFDFGPGPVTFQLSKKPIKIAPLICFEDTLGNLARKFVLQGAQLFVTVTNDAWFLKSAGSEQHLANAIFRCVEMRRPMVRAANTGVTCVIDSVGRETMRLEDEKGNSFVEGVLIASVEVPNNPPLTFYALNGEIFSVACLAMAGLFAIPAIIRRRK